MNHIRMSQAYLETQSALVNRLCHVASQRRLSFAIVSQAWDETEQSLFIPLRPDLLTREQQTCKWHVLVCRRHVVLAFKPLPGDACAHPVITSFDLVVPAIPLVSTSSSCIFFGLYRTHAGRQFVMLCDTIEPLSDITIYNYRADGASGNDKLVAFLTSQSYVTFVAFDVCSLHSCKLIESTAIAVVGLKVLNCIYATALFLRMGSYFMRMLMVLQQLIARTVLLLTPSQDCLSRRDAVQELYVDEVIDYSLCNAEYVRPQKKGKSMEECSDSDSEQKPMSCKHGTFIMHDALLQLRLLDRSSWLQFGWVHVCTCEAACTRHHIAELLNSLAIRAIFRRLPTVPAASKWTKFAPALDFMVVGFLYKNALPAMFAASFGKRFNHKGKVDGIPDDFEAQLAEDISFHEVAGKRWHKISGFLMDPDTRPRLTTLAIAIEPLRFLMRWFFRLARNVRKPCSWPALLDVISPSTSPLVSVLQLWGSVLQGSSSRLILLWLPAKCSSLANWLSTRPDEVSLLRRLILTLVSWVHRRYVVRFTAFPWKLAAVTDGRLGLDGAREVLSLNTFQYHQYPQYSPQPPIPKCPQYPNVPNTCNTPQIHPVSPTTHPIRPNAPQYPNAPNTCNTSQIHSIIPALASVLVLELTFAFVLVLVLLPTGRSYFVGFCQLLFGRRLLPTIAGSMSVICLIRHAAIIWQPCPHSEYE